VPAVLSFPVPPTSDDILQRMVNAVELVRQRLLRATAALASHAVPYAVAGGNAVAAWVATVDEAAVRNTQAVDVLIRREDFERAKVALEGAGFVYKNRAGNEIFIDDVNAHPRHSVKLSYTDEYLATGADGAHPVVEDSTDIGEYRVLNLLPLVRLKLCTFDLDDRVDLRDLIDIGLIDQSWTAKFQPVLAARLQGLLDTPDG